MKIDEDQNMKIGIGIVAVAILGYFLIKTPDNGTGYGDDPTGNNLDNNNPVLFSPKIAAEKLYESMRTMGTDESAIMQVFQTVSVGNFSKVYHAFGKRSYNTQLGNQYNFNPIFNLPLHTLSSWLENELSSSSFETLRIKYKSTNLI